MRPVLLIANRGEIASRIIRTAKRLGIETVAMYSDADKDWPYVCQADRAYRVGPAAVESSYMNQTAILELAKRVGATAIHPGYGFLSEQAGFAQACLDQGLLFIGPSAEVIRTMGDKALAKHTVSGLGIPVLPTVSEDEWANHSAYPILLKAVAGGGGRAMRVVNHPDALSAAIDAVKQEALIQFGNPEFIIERFFPKARHIEVQILQDRYGHCVHLFERDCSIQRRRQKLIEESPAYGLEAGLSQSLYQNSMRIAKAVKYLGVGTVEYLIVADQAYFMEMNTRLQVEHAVTESITGLDLVEWQWRMAMGEALPFTQDQIHVHGHAIELRIIAEKPDTDFSPALTRADHCIQALVQPKPHEGLRLDLGIAVGCRLTPFYDNLLGKLIGWGVDRAQALASLKQGLAEWHLLGVDSNLSYLNAVLRHPVFIAGRYSTDFVSRHHTDCLEQSLKVRNLLVQAAWIGFTQNHAALQAQRVSPWLVFSPQLSVPQTLLVLPSWAEQPVLLTAEDHKGIQDAQLLETEIRWTADSQRYSVAYLRLYDGLYADQETLSLTYQGQSAVFKTLPWGLKKRSSEACSGLNLGWFKTSNGLIQAAMPGLIRDIMVEAGQMVSKGQPLLSMEAMKMMHTLEAPEDSSVQAIACALGQAVKEGDMLFHLVPRSENPSFVCLDSLCP